MTRNPRVLELLEQLLDSQKSPEEVCRDCPELLPEVLYRWHEFQRIDGQVRSLLPGLGTLPSPSAAPTEKLVEPPAAFGRYRVQHPIGSGGFGTVYLGHDTQLDRLVAIKVLRSDRGTGHRNNDEALREARRLAQLRHPGIVMVHDIGIEAGQYYVVSDYLEGPALNVLLRTQRLGWEAATTIAAAVADALGHAHAQRIVHRDVKPSNILLTADGAPVLVDFGLALDETEAGGSAKGIIAGTPWYMSPEQATGMAYRVDGRTDIYSLGVVLYEMLTGRVPFHATQTPELLRQVRDDEPQPPRQLVAEIPAEIERVCLKALAKRQQDRYFTAADFAADLRRELPAAASPPRIGRPISRSTWSSFARLQRRTVGRKQELAELHHAFEIAAAGRGNFVCVTGEPGIGKTTLIEDFVDELNAANQSFTLARGRCSERLAGTEAYLPVLEVLESLLAGGGTDETARTMKLRAPNWYERVVPLAAQDSSLKQILADSRAASQERLKRELCALFLSESQARTLVIFIDDLHWADASTVDLLAYLASKCAAMRILVVFTLRPTELAIRKHPFGPVKLDLQARGICRELVLEFLRREQIDEYLNLEFPGHRFPDEFAELVHARTEGSPLFVVSLLHYLRDRQVLAPQAGGWELRQAVPNLRRDLPESVRSMIQRKLGQLSDSDRQLLVAASVEGYEFNSAVIARVLQLEAAVVEDRLDELGRVHAFVRVLREQVFPDGTLSVRYRFVHILYQNVLFDSLQPTRRASLSAAVVEALLAFHGENSAEVAGDLAILLESARDLARAADYFLIAAQNATRVFANEEAVLLARRGIEALAALPDSPLRSRTELSLQITLGPALFATQDWTTPDVENAYTRAQQLCEELGESPDLFPAVWGLFLFHIARGEIPTGLQQGVRLLNLAQETQDPGLLLQAHHALGPTYGLVGEWEAAQQHLDQAVACYDRDKHRTHAFRYAGHDPCVCCQSFAAKSLWMLGYPDRALAMSRQALALARELGHPTSLAHTQYSVAILHQFRRDVYETLKLSDELLELASDQGLPFYRAGGLVLRGWALGEQGEHDAGLAEIEQGFALGGATRAHWRAYLLALHAETLAKLGLVPDSLHLLQECFALADRTSIRMYEPEMYRLRGAFVLARDASRLADAEASFRASIEVARRQKAKSLELRTTLSLGRLLQRQGRMREAHAEVEAIFGGFTEGWTTPDLVDAATLLSDLADRGGGV